MPSSAKKPKKSFVCKECGSVSAQWGGQCSGCGGWNTLEERIEENAPKGAPARLGYSGQNGKLVVLSQVASGNLVRYRSGLAEFDRVLGGGIVVGGSVVLGGNPGAGKSTLLLQSSTCVAEERKVIYCAGEESLEQIRDRGSRLTLPMDKLLVIAETNVVAIGNLMEAERPDLIIVDSIQTAYHPELESEPGNVSQVKTCAAYLNRKAKALGVSLVLVGHINKAESLAGPMALEHIVDTILMLSSTDDDRFRIMRPEKNRFGSTSEVGIFAMTGTGLKVVENPSSIFLERAIDDAPGSVVTPLWQGSRPMLVEVQALVDETTLANPRRVSIGLDNNRIAMLLAVMNKHSGIAVGLKDVYVNVVGGIRVAETSADLAVMLTAMSSITNKVIPSDVMAFGEIGLSGEVRPCAYGHDRIREAAKLGFKRALVPAANYPKDGVQGMDVIPVATLAAALEWLDQL